MSRGQITAFCVGAILLIAFGLMWVIVGKRRRRYLERLRQTGYRATGVVIDYAYRGGEDGPTPYPVVRFPGPDGRPITAESTFGGSLIPEKGAEVPVLFDPDDPDTVHLEHGIGDRAPAIIQATGWGIIACSATAMLVALLLYFVFPPTSSTSSDSSTSSAPSGPVTEPTVQLGFDQLKPGDCLQVPDVHAIPGIFTPVPCTQPHTMEVFFRGDVWPQSLAYPGDKAVIDQADARCVTAFTAYDGIPPDQSVFNYSENIPSSDSWSSGDRSVACAAHELGGASREHSIKGSR